MNPNTLALTQEYLRHRESLLTQFPELAEDEQALSDTLEGISDIGDVIARFIRDALDDQASVEALALRIRDMGERKTRLQSRSDKRRAIALSLMAAVGMKKIEQPDFTANVGVSPPRVIIIDEALIPDQFMRVKREPDKLALREQLSGSVDVPGAALGNSEPSLRVRTK